MKLSKNLMKNKLLVVFVFIVFIFACTSLWSLAHASEVTFTWGESSGQVDGYRIYAGTAAGGPYSNIMGEVDGTTLTQTLTLNETREYFLICRAFNSYGESGDSNEVHWFYAVPGAPDIFHWMIKVETTTRIELIHK